MKEKHLFKKPLIERMMEAISNMSKRASAIYLILLSAVFLAGLALLLVGVIYIPLDGSEVPTYSIVLAVAGFIVMLVACVAVTLTTLSSNYVKSRQQQRDEALKAKNEDGQVREEKEEDETKEN